MTAEALHDLFVRYRVARTVPGHVEEIGLETKYRPFTDILNRYVDVTMTVDSVPGIIDREVENLRVPYSGIRLWSAVSKAFWMMKRHPVVIYDNFAWRGLQKLRLRPGERTYREYFDAWFRFFERRETQVELDSTLEWAVTQPRTRELVRMGCLSFDDVNSLWFRNRVTDMWLALHGGANW